MMRRRALGGCSKAALWLLTAAFLTVSPFPVGAIDKNGKYAVEGAGMLSCQEFVAAREARSSDYDRFLGWLEGFGTAANLYERGTFDITPWQTTGVLAVIIDNHCRKNPDEQFAAVVQRLLGTFMKDRLQGQSPTVELSASRQTTRVYEDVVRKAQLALAKRGLYRSLPTGQYNEKTQQALQTFQAREGLEVTGLPDAVTLWKLLQP